ncbi:DNA helicase [Paramuricea clavata]|uniref:DNA helicase n=1 Tax=Paramuricea clavata TaxID=317549 RepID=A0A6S7FTF7_PARCT|nr:DNA helicase [Paramuricea clavata]
MSALPDGGEKQQRLKSLNHMVDYCMIPSCRKSQLVRYFDGASSSSCNERCDVCKQSPNPPLNGTEHARSVVACVQSMIKIDSNVSVKYLALTYRGSRSKEIVNEGYVNAQNHGSGSKDFNSKTMYKFIHLLITGGILQEKLRTVSDTKTTPLLVLGEKASQVLERDFKFVYYK